MNTLIADKIIEQLETLPYASQQRVLEFTRALATTAPRGIPGRQLLHFAGVIPAEDLQMMRLAIAEACEQIDRDEW